MSDPTVTSEPVAGFIIVNAIIKGARIGLSRGSFLDAWLDLDYGGLCQGFGGFVLGGTPDAKCGNHKETPNLAAEFIVSCLRAGDVESWSDLVGKTIRVRKTDEWGDILAIGHIVKEDRWFSPRDVFGLWMKEKQR